MIVNMKTIGIVGGGQLGRMLTLAAKPLGFSVIVIDPTPDCPAKQVGAEQIVASMQDQAAIDSLARRADVVTIESEHVNAEALQALDKAGTPVHPAPQTIQLIQDKLSQKQFLASKNIPTAPFLELTDQNQTKKALKTYGSMLVKARFGSFDGRGNWKITDESQLDELFTSLGDRKVYAEQIVSFATELAVVGARDTNGTVKLFPVVETTHERHICTSVVMPAKIDEKIRQNAEALATQVLTELKGVGVFAIEMFLTKDNKLLVNEIAPRVHNSGHLTIEACQTSQFEQHIRAVAGLPLGDTAPCAPAAAMINVLGERDGETDVQGLAEALSEQHTHVHLYGKSPTKIDRKMGHITTTAQTAEEALEHATNARKHITI